MKKGEMPSWSLGGGRSYPKNRKRKEKRKSQSKG